MRLTKAIGWTTLLAVPATLLAAALPASGAVARTASPGYVTSHAHIRLSASALIVGQQLTGTVVVTPRVAGRPVYFQRQRARRWQNLAVGVTDSTGALSRTLNLGIGTFKIRVSVGATPSSTAAISSTDTVVVSAVPPPYAGAPLSEGSSGPQVLALEQRLTELGYWLGTPGSYFGDATQQAVFAFQKAAGINPTGIVYPNTVAALQSGVLPTPRTHSGYVIEVDLKDDLVMFVNNGQIEHVLNTSTGGGYTYTEDGATDVATTPTGIFSINRAVNGLVVDTLGALWRPRFFYEGFAIHGDSYVPSVPVSHGCVRVSNEAIDWIWANNLAPLGTEVWVYG